jgi:opacity protein-like surface antigen
MVGFGVLGSGFASGIIYGTPVFNGLQLNVGAFDPASLGSRGWVRTKYARAEAELTFERKFGQTGKVVLFANGAYQKIYKDGYCATTAASPLPCSDIMAGFGYGGRFELGRVRLGVAGHYGKGLGLNYALENSDAALDPQGNLRKFDGYIVQSQVVLGKFDVFAGWGISRALLTDYDLQPRPATDAISVIKYQMGINAGVVYNLTPSVHLDLEYFRAEADWWLREKQVLHCSAAGLTFNW